MRLREANRLIFPVIITVLILISGNRAFTQECLLNREVNLSHTTNEISEFLKEIGKKGNFSFTYTSRVQVHRIASVTEKKQMVRQHLADIFRFDSIKIVEQNNKILLIPPVKGQSAISGNRLIKGLVIDAKTRNPLAYSNVFLEDKSIGVISNTSGRFELKIDTSDYKDTLAVSYIGYAIEKYPVEMLDSSLLIVRLTTSKINLKEIVIKPLDPVYIITKAIEAVPENYDKEPVVYNAFYRESTKQDRKNISLSEAVVNIFKEPYTSFRQDQIKIFKGRNGSNTDEKEFVDFIVQGSLYNMLQLDIVKNHPTFLDPDYFALYEYRLERIISVVGRPTYLISFDQREDVKYPCYKGELYIDVSSLAIVGALFELSENRMDYTSGVYVRKTPKRVGAKPLNAVYEVFYRYYASKWNLSNARSEINIRVKKRRDKNQEKFNAVFSSVSEFVVTGKDTVNITRFKTDEIVRPRDVFSKQLTGSDIEFWGDENIIIPEEPIEKAIINLNRKNNIFTDQEINAIKIEEEKDNNQIKEDIESDKESFISEDDE